MAPEAAPTPGSLLSALAVPRGRVTYVQSSVDWMQRAGLGAADMFAALKEWVGETGTLVMPSYPFHATHLEYLESNPVFDVRKTPSAIGLLPEMLRRTRGALRSLDPDFCVTALGGDAAAIAGLDPSAPDPFGADSAYQRMLDRDAVLVGLGVSLNTSSFIHAIDSRAQGGYPQPVYLDRAFVVPVTDRGGVVRMVPRLALRPGFQRLTMPSAINRDMQPPSHVFASREINGACFFRWELAPWSAWCLAHAAERAAAATWPCWLERLSGSSS